MGADVTAVDDNGCHALHLILDNPNLKEDTVLQFLEHEEGKHLLNVPNNAGFTPLHCALRLLRPAVCESMIANGADLLKPDSNGNTALHYISAQCLRLHRPIRCSTGSVDLGTEYINGCKRLWQRFLDLGGSINACNSRIESPLLIHLASPQREGYQPKPGTNCHIDHFDSFFGATDSQWRNVDGERALHIYSEARKDVFHDAGA